MKAAERRLWRSSIHKHRSASSRHPLGQNIEKRRLSVTHSPARSAQHGDRSCRLRQLAKRLQPIPGNVPCTLTRSVEFNSPCPRWAHEQCERSWHRLPRDIAQNALGHIALRFWVAHRHVVLKLAPFEADSRFPLIPWGRHTWGCQVMFRHSRSDVRPSF